MSSDSGFSSFLGSSFLAGAAPFLSSALAGAAPAAGAAAAGAGATCICQDGKDAARVRRGRRHAKEKEKGKQTEDNEHKAHKADEQHKKSRTSASVEDEVIEVLGLEDALEESRPEGLDGDASGLHDGGDRGGGHGDASIGQHKRSVSDGKLVGA